LGKVVHAEVDPEDEVVLEDGFVVEESAGLWSELNGREREM
jgi:hypothetical protein